MSSKDKPSLNIKQRMEDICKNTQIKDLQIKITVWDEKYAR